MASDNGEESKIHDPTPRRLQELRRKGDIPRSADLSAAIGLGGIVLALLVTGVGMAEHLGDLGATLIDRSPELSTMLLSGHGGGVPGGLLASTGAALTPLYAVPAALVLLALAAQRALLFTPDKLTPKISRISIVQNAKNKFGLAGIVEFLKSFLKLLVFSAALGVYLAMGLHELVLSATLSPGQVAARLARLMVEFLGIVFGIALTIGALDLIWQIAEHRRRNRMSHKELRDDVKEAEGDPMLKDRRRQKGLSLSQNRMLDDVGGASVVVVNPTHVAVALRWDPATDAAPVCVAKGIDHVALRIREKAEDAAVPLHHDPVTARTLFATVELGEEVGGDLYAPVAAAIRFADEVRERARRSPL